MTTFGLVHGAWHGAWCWDDLVPELVAAGHSCIAMDLPCDDVQAGWEQYASTAVDALADADDDLILVGHSLGGGVIPLVAARRPARRLVFLCSYPAAPGESLNESVRDEPALTDPRALAWRDCLDSHGRYVWPDLESAVYAMYHDCSAESAESAFRRLRPQAQKPFSERFPLASWPDVSSVFIVCRDDRMGSPASLRRVASRRFGIDAIELPGSHSPFLSEPRALASVLSELGE